MTAPFAYSFGHNRADAHPQICRADSFDELQDAVLSARHDRSKDEAPYFARAFGINGADLPQRAREFAEPCAWIALDVDHLTVEAAPMLTAALAEKRGFWHASMSATLDNLKRRIVLECSRVVELGEHKQVVEAVETWLLSRVGDGIELDRAASGDVARLWYLPAESAAAGVFVGEPIDVDHALAYAKRKEPTATEHREAYGKTFHKTGEGGRNALLTRVAGKLRRDGLSASELAAALQQMNRERCDPPLGDTEVDTIARSVGKYPAPATDPRADAADAPTNTEMEIAAAFAERGARSLLYVAGMDWYTNAGTHWRRDEKLSRFTLANELCREAGSAAQGAARTRIETNKTAAAIVTIARPALIAVPAEFDRLPHELNTPDGVLDLRDGVMRSRAASDRFMHCTAVTPDSKGIAGTVFAEFLSAITCGDGGLARFLQTMLGAALFASNALEDHWIAFLVGSGRNGKGTLVEKCAGRAMGTYARRIPAEVLLADDRGTRHPTEIANLVGARLAYATEIDEGRRWNEARVKELSGGDKLSGRFMRQDLFEFVPSHRLVIYANHRPMIQNPDPAFRARLRIVPFSASFIGHEDTTLPDRLFHELPRILGWMIAGASDYWEAGRLANCAAVDTASAAYFALHATFDAWLEERCYVDATLEERSKALYANFKAWKEERGEGVPSQSRWGETMSSRFQRRESHGVIWCGIGLRP